MQNCHEIAKQHVSLLHLESFDEKNKAQQQCTDVGRRGPWMTTICTHIFGCEWIKNKGWKFFNSFITDDIFCVTSLHPLFHYARASWSDYTQPRTRRLYHWTCSTSCPLFSFTLRNSRSIWVQNTVTAQFREREFSLLNGPTDRSLHLMTAG